MRRFLTLARLVRTSQQEQHLVVPLASSSRLAPFHQTRRSLNDQSASNDGTFLGAKKDRLSGSTTKSTKGKDHSSMSSMSGRTRSSGGDQRRPEQVKLDKRNHRFTLDLGNNQVARIDFKTNAGDSHCIDMYHTEVPRELRGRGLGKVLASGALQRAAGERMRVKLSCSYLVDYLKKRPKDPNAHIVDTSGSK